MDSGNYVEQYLERLGLQQRAANRAYLDEIVDAHQKKVVWENITKMIDWESGSRTGDFLPNIETLVQRITKFGAGGTCWTLAMAMHWLLNQLGFYASYMYMDSGHLCVRVDLDQPYYVDVGYCAPLFQAHPVFSSFTAKNTREVFDYRFDGNTIEIVRTPGPTKTLNPTPISLDDVRPIIQRSNDWSTSPVLQHPRIFGYVNGVPTSLTGKTLKRHYDAGVEEVELDNVQLVDCVEHEFGMNIGLFREAMDVFRTHATEAENYDFD